MVSGGMACVKYLLFLFNLVFAVRKKERERKKKLCSNPRKPLFLYLHCCFFFAVHVPEVQVYINFLKSANKTTTKEKAKMGEDDVWIRYTIATTCIMQISRFANSIYIKKRVSCIKVSFFFVVPRKNDVIFGNYSLFHYVLLRFLQFRFAGAMCARTE